MNDFQIKEIRFKYRGKEHQGTVAIPQDLAQAIEILGENEVMKCFMIGYIEDQKRKIRTKRVKKYQKIALENLTQEQRDGLKVLGLL